MVKNVCKFCHVIIILMLFSIAFSTTVSALVYKDTFYNDRAYNWTYDAPNTNSYNCLGYAMRTYTWLWPWPKGPVTHSMANSYFASKRYMNLGTGYYGSGPYILAYSENGSVTHFALTKSGDESRNTAKWGVLERFIHTSRNPYKPLIHYGYYYAIYKFDPNNPQ